MTAWGSVSCGREGQPPEASPRGMSSDKLQRPLLRTVGLTAPPPQYTDSLRRSSQHDRRGH